MHFTWRNCTQFRKSFIGKVDLTSGEGGCRGKRLAVGSCRGGLKVSEFSFKIIGKIGILMPISKIEHILPIRCPYGSVIVKNTTLEKFSTIEKMTLEGGPLEAQKC